jgi:nitrite reductase/ring-hydroxylating ferredoxin subunit
VDGLPYIGRNSADRHVYIGLGYSGTGLTFGTVAAMLISDLILGRKNPYADLFSATRIKPLASVKEFVAENVDFPLHLIFDRVAPAETRSTEDIVPGEGKLMTVNGKKVAVYRARDGAVCAMSATCTHMGCIVHWNTAEKSWDCPCHGGRYDAMGKVINGPPTHDLAREKMP